MMRAILLASAVLFSFNANATERPRGPEVGNNIAASSSQSAAHASSRATSTSISGANATGGSARAYGGSSRSQSNNSVNVDSSQRDRLQAPSVFAPSIAGNNNCGLGASVGGSIAGFGVGGGTSWEGKVCRTIAIATVAVVTLNQRDVGREVMCGLEEYAAAAARAGQPCGGTRVDVPATNRQASAPGSFRFN